MTVRGTPNLAGERPPSTSRVRSHREARKKSGGAQIYGYLGGAAAAALDLLRAHGGIGGRGSKIAVIEALLLAEARRLAPTTDKTRKLVQGGYIPPEVGAKWQEELTRADAARQPGSPVGTERAHRAGSNKR